MATNLLEALDDLVNPISEPVVPTLPEPSSETVQKAPDFDLEDYFTAPGGVAGGLPENINLIESIGVDGTVEDQEEKGLVARYPSTEPIELDANTLPTPAQIVITTANAAVTDIQSADLHLANTMVVTVLDAWKQPVASLRHLSKLMDLTIKVTRHRRDVLGVAYGNITSKKGNTGGDTDWGEELG